MAHLQIYSWNYYVYTSWTEEQISLAVLILTQSIAKELGIPYAMTNETKVPQSNLTRPFESESSRLNSTNFHHDASCHCEQW